MQYIATLNGKKFLVESNAVLTQEQVSNHVINHVVRAGRCGMLKLGTATCGGPYVKDSSHTLTGSVTSGGTEPFTYTWTITKPDTTTETLTEASQAYTFAQEGTYTIDLVVTDSCASGAKSDPATCNVVITAECTIPVCTINVV